MVIANTTSNNAPLIDLGLWSSEPLLAIGANFTGCILQGAGTELTNPLIKHSGVEWGTCPLPDGTDCSEFETFCVFCAVVDILLSCMFILDDL